MANFCPNCGAKLNPEARFCPNCGKSVGGGEPQSSPEPQPVKSAPKPKKQTNATEAFAAAQQANQQAAQPKKKKGGFFKFLVIALILGGIGYGCFGEPGWLKPKRDPGYYYGSMVLPTTGTVQRENTAILSGSGFGVTVTEGGGVAGSVDSEGLSVQVGDGAFETGSVLRAAPVSESAMETLKKSGKFDVLGQVYDFTCDGYDGSFFASGDMKITVPIPETDGGFRPEDYVFFYTDESGQVRYLEPAGYDTENKTMWVSVPHFSGLGSGKTKDQETIDRFLKDYTTKVVMEKHNQERAMAELAPYLKEKIDALGLRKEAAKDLLQSTINIIGGSFTMEGEGNEHVGEFVSLGVSYSTGATRAILEKDGDAFLDNLSGTANNAIMIAWNGMDLSKRAGAKLGKVFNSDVVKEVAPDGVGAVVGNAGSVGSLAGYLYEGEMESAAKELGNILQSVHPAAELGTKGAKFIAASVETEFIEWKKNEMEELYRIYKNGARDFWGNEVEAQNRESFTEYLNYGGGFVQKRIVSRLYNLDEIEKICKRYGWEFNDYKNLPEQNREIIMSRIEENILDYFERRAQQETEAEALAEKERVCIEEMLNSSSGLLRSINYSSLFREDSEHPYSMENRLNRIMNMRNMISVYVDEEKLGKHAYDPDGYNWGYLLNNWGSYIDKYPKAEAINLFCRFLDGIGLLKDLYKDDLTDISAFTGSWYGIGDFDDIIYEISYDRDDDRMYYAVSDGEETQGDFADSYEIVNNTLRLMLYDDLDERDKLVELRYTLTDNDHLTITFPGGAMAYCARTPEDDEDDDDWDWDWDYDDSGENDYSLETATLDHNWD